MNPLVYSAIQAVFHLTFKKGKFMILSELNLQIITVISLCLSDSQKLTEIVTKIGGR